MAEDIDMKVAEIRQAQYGKEAREPVAGCLEIISKKLFSKNKDIEKEVHEARGDCKNLDERLGALEQQINKTNKTLEQKKKLLRILYGEEAIDNSL